MGWSLFKRSAKDKLFGSTKDDALGVQKLEMADARRGVIYFLGNTQSVVVPKFDGGVFSSFIADPTCLSDLKNGSVFILEKTGPGKKIVQGVTKAKDAITGALAPIYETIKGFFSHLYNKIVERFGNDADGIEAIGEYIVWAAAELSQAMTSLIPGWGYVQSAADMYKGARQAVIAAKEFVTQLYSGYGVKLLGGHPAIIANALARHSLAQFGGGLKDVAVGAGKIALQAGGDALAGVGALFSALTGALQRIANLVDRYIQRFQVQKVLRRARQEWAIRDSDASLVASHKQFSEWFQSAVILTPVVAAMVLGSGFAAHPYRFLALLKVGDEVVTGSQFSAGVKHIETLKGIAGRYVSNYIDNYRVKFVSDDKLIQARLNELQTGMQVEHIDWHTNPLYTGT